jgi:hypothetical protein
MFVADQTRINTLNTLVFANTDPPGTWNLRSTLLERKHLRTKIEEKITMKKITISGAVAISNRCVAIHHMDESLE